MIAPQISLKIESLYGLGRQVTKLYAKVLYEILQFLQGSHLDTFPLKTFKLGWVDFN